MPLLSSIELCGLLMLANFDLRNVIYGSSEVMQMSSSLVQFFEHMLYIHVYIRFRCYFSQFLHSIIKLISFKVSTEHGSRKRILHGFSCALFTVFAIKKVSRDFSDKHGKFLSEF